MYVGNLDLDQGEIDLFNKNKIRILKIDLKLKIVN